MVPPDHSWLDWFIAYLQLALLFVGILACIVLFFYAVYLEVRIWEETQQLQKPKKLKMLNKSSYFWGAGISQAEDQVNTPLLGKKTKTQKYSQIV